MAQPALAAQPTHGRPGLGAVELAEVSKHYGDIVAIDGITLTVQPGEFMTLLGPSGCGKTTTLRLIGGFVQPTSGSVIIGGEPMGDRPPYLRPVNTVFQNYALFPHMTVGQNVGYGLVMAKVPARERERRVAEALELVRLAGVENRSPAELSGGQQQRVALARALVNRPEVLLLDEPLGALDLSLRQAMQLELKQIQRDANATFIYVTHDQDEALTMSDRIAVMHAGRVLQVGGPTEVYDQPNSVLVAGFMGQNNLLLGRLRDTSGGSALVDVAGVGELRGRPVAGLRPGTEVTVGIRPELVTLHREPGESPVAWNEPVGTVTDLQYAGTHWRVTVTLGNGATVVAHQPPGRRPGEEFRQGETVRLRFRPDETMVLSR
jgi:spermidine/putrescine ABC transporter ATP-binding subunit